jgi:cell division septation protein DedD
MNNTKLFLYTFLMLTVITIFACSAPTINGISRKAATGNTKYVSQVATFQMPLITDLNITDRIISGSFYGSDVAEEFAKNMAVANALKTSGGEVLVEPQYFISLENKNLTVEVRGHAATYKNFRKPEPDPYLYPQAKAGKKETAYTPKKPVETYTAPKPTYSEPIIEEEKIVAETPAKSIAESVTETEPATPEVKEVAPAKAEIKPVAEPEKPAANGKLPTPSFLVVCTAMAKETDAKAFMMKLASEGYEAGSLWIPDYEPQGKKLYRVYVGPFDTKEEAQDILPDIKTDYKFAYLLNLK